MNLKGHWKITRTKKEEEKHFCWRDAAVCVCASCSCIPAILQLSSLLTLSRSWTLRDKPHVQSDQSMSNLLLVLDSVLRCAHAHHEHKYTNHQAACHYTQSLRCWVCSRVCMCACVCVAASFNTTPFNTALHAYSLSSLPLCLYLFLPPFAC